MGPGTLVLAASNTYSGSTAIGGGTLQIGNGTSGEGLASPTVSNSGTLAFDNADSVTYSGSISGAGSLAMSGSGLLILSGSNTYSGGTAIGSGTLQIGNGTSGEGLASPTVSNRGTLAFNHADSLTYSGSIAGTGSLVKTGSGVLTLNGSNSYSGGTTVSGGILDIAVGAALPGGGVTTIRGNGMLGFGTIGTLLGASPLIGSSEVAPNVAAAPMAIGGGYESTSGNVAMLGVAAVSSQSEASFAIDGSAAAVPEPAAPAMLLVAAVAGLVVWRRKRLLELVVEASL